MPKPKNPVQEPEFPPQVPTERAELLRVVTLLGERVKHELRFKHKTALIDLLGMYPSAETAARWKSELKRLAQDEIFKPSP